MTDTELKNLKARVRREMSKWDPDALTYTYDEASHRDIYDACLLIKLGATPHEAVKMQFESFSDDKQEGENHD